MDLFSETTPNTLSLLSIGQRGVGKTVFLVGSYAELHANDQAAEPKPVWFDCQDGQVQQNLEQIFNYITRTGQYPPATMKITNFDFQLKRRTSSGTETLAAFRWWDVPGEACKTDNRDFHHIVSSSSGCCAFIDAHALIHDRNYLLTLEDIFAQVAAIATLVSLNHLKYAFALILTKGDLINLPADQQQLEERLQPLTARLADLEVPYQVFCSVIPIVSKEGTWTLEATNAAAPLLWIVSELSQVHQRRSQAKGFDWLTQRLPSSLRPQQPSAQGLVKSLHKSPKDLFGIRKALRPLELRFQALPTDTRYILLAGLAVVVSMGLLSPLFFGLNFKQAQAPNSTTQTKPEDVQKQILQSQQALQRQPNNVGILKQLVTLHLQVEQFNQAVPQLEKLVQLEPDNLEQRVQLAQLYEITDQVDKAEAAYDQVLTREKDHLEALIGKAALRTAAGDSKAATALFSQAEQAAPADLKPRIREMAQNSR